MQEESPRQPGVSVADTTFWRRVRGKPSPRHVVRDVAPVFVFLFVCFLLFFPRIFLKIFKDIPMESKKDPIILYMGVSSTRLRS